MWSRARSGLSLFFRTASMAPPGRNTFLEPWMAGPHKDYSKNVVYSIGTIVRFEWAINFDKPDLQLWQDNRPGDAQGGPNAIIEEALSSNIYWWYVSYHGLDPRFNNVFYVQLQNGNDTVTSHYFNITDATAASSITTASASSTTTASASSTTTSASTTLPATSTTMPPPPPTTTTKTTETPNGGGGLSTGAAAGIAVGATAGIFILVGGLWWWWRSRKKTRSGKAAETQPSWGQGGHKPYDHENPAESQVYEAAGPAVEPRYYEAPTHTESQYFEAPAPVEPRYHEAGGVEIGRQQ